MKEDKLKYLNDGSTVYLVEELKDSRFLVSDIFIDEYGEESFGALHIVDAIYDTCPVKLYNTQLLEVKKLVEKLRDEEETIKYRISSLSQKEKGILDRLKNSYVLEHLLDFIDNKITHYIRASSFEIVETKNANKDFYGDFKLLTLFGNSKGDLTWKLNQYGDGSGGNTTVVPCISYKMALEELQKLVDKYISENISEKNYVSSIIIECAKKYNLQLPEGYIDQYRLQWAEGQEKRIKEKENELLELKNKKCDI